MKVTKQVGTRKLEAYEAPRILEVHQLRGTSVLEYFSMEVDFEDFEDGGDF